jgi:site-specific DNA-methyltransferase (adenine-specific)
MTRKKRAAEVQPEPTPHAAPQPSAAGPRIRNKEIRRVRVADIVDNPLNPRSHPDFQKAAFNGAETELGFFGYPDVVEHEGKIILVDGELRKHHLLDKYGPDTEIEVNVTDFTLEESRKALATKDALAALAETDGDNLAALLAGMETQDAALAEMLVKLAEDANVVPPDDLSSLAGRTADPARSTQDTPPELREGVVSRPGEIWCCGAHRIACADCRDAEAVQRLLGDVLIDVAFTSPPYAAQRAYDEASGFVMIQPDDYVAWWERVQQNVRRHLNPATGSFFVNIKAHVNEGERVLYVMDLVCAMKRQWGWKFIDDLCWERIGLPGQYRGRFKSAWEPIYHFSLANANAIKFAPERVGRQSDDVPVYDLATNLNPVGSLTGVPNNRALHSEHGRNREHIPGIALPSNRIRTNQGEGQEHEAAFPVALPAFFILAFSDEGDAVYDCFSGSGSTVAAAHQTGRHGFGMDLSARYTDQSVRRLQLLTGEKAIRESDAVEFDSVAPRPA